MKLKAANKVLAKQLEKERERPIPAVVKPSRQPPPSPVTVKPAAPEVVSSPSEDARRVDDQTLYLESPAEELETWTERRQRRRRSSEAELHKFKPNSISNPSSDHPSLIGRPLLPSFSLSRAAMTKNMMITNLPGECNWLPSRYAFPNPDLGWAGTPNHNPDPDLNRQAKAREEYQGRLVAILLVAISRQEAEANLAHTRRHDSKTPQGDSSRPRRGSTARTKSPERSSRLADSQISDPPLDSTEDEAPLLIEGKWDGSCYLVGASVLAGNQLGTTDPETPLAPSASESSREAEPEVPAVMETLKGAKEATRRVAEGGGMVAIRADPVDNVTLSESTNQVRPSEQQPEVPPPPVPCERSLGTNDEPVAKDPGLPAEPSPLRLATPPREPRPRGGTSPRHGAAPMQTTRIAVAEDPEVPVVHVEESSRGPTDHAAAHKDMAVSRSRAASLELPGSIERPPKMPSATKRSPRVARQGRIKTDTDGIQEVTQTDLEVQRDEEVRRRADAAAIDEREVALRVALEKPDEKASPLKEEKAVLEYRPGTESKEGSEGKARDVEESILQEKAAQIEEARRLRVSEESIMQEKSERDAPQRQSAKPTARVEKSEAGPVVSEAGPIVSASEPQAVGVPNFTPPPIRVHEISSVTSDRDRALLEAKALALETGALEVH